MRGKNPQLVVIVGETGSGKSALALRLAKQFNGEIIAADSRTVYKGMDIGTAKPTAEERAAVPHHLLDVVEPDQKFSAADFKQQAQQAINDIALRGKLPIMVGGSGLYIDSLLFDYRFLPPPKADSRNVLNQKSVNELQLMLVERGLPLPENPKNPRHLIRAIETDGQTPARGEIRPNTLILGLSVSRAELKSRVTERVDSMIKNGLINEIQALSRRYGWEAEAMKAPAYKAFRSYLEGREPQEDARQAFISNDLALAKRQRTWFKRNKSIQWLPTPVNWPVVVESVTTFLNT